MKLVIFISLFFIITGCNKPKTVLICGDHVCVNKEEAEQFFEENLTIEVKVVDKKKDENIDLVQLNLKEDDIGNKKISVSSKEKTNKEIKILSNDEVIKIKENIKKKKKNKKIANKKINKEINIKKDKKKQTNKKPKQNNNLEMKNKTYKKVDVVDVCTLIKKCNIEEISKYLLKEGKNKKFPDITKRQ